MRRASRSVARAAAMACVSAALAACTLPYEQLTLPAPITANLPPPGPGPDGSRPGSPMSGPADQGANQSRIYPGEPVMGGHNGADAGGAGQLRTAGGQASGATVSAAGVSLDLENAKPSEAAKAILGDVLGVTYVVSDKVKAPITLKTARPVSADDLVAIFEAVLATNDAALVVDGALYKVLPMDEAIAGGKLVSRRSSRPGARQHGIASEIIPLRYVAAEEMEKILKSVAPQSVISRVDNARNILVVSGSKADVASMRDAIATFDVDHLRGMSFGIFPVESDDPVALAQELDIIFGNDKPGPTKGVVRFVPNARMKAILVMTARGEYLQKAETWISRIDLAGRASEKQAFVYHVQHRTALEIAQLLQKVYAPPRPRSDGAVASDALTTGSLSTATGSTAPTLEGFENAPPSSRTMFSPPPIPVAPTTSAATAQPLPLPGPAAQAGLTAATQTGDADAGGEGAAAGAGAATDPALSLAAKPRLDDRFAQVSIVPDETNNAVIITATSSEMRRIKQVLKQLDIRPRQVLIEATIAEVTLTDDLRFGLRWFFQKGSNEFRFTDSTLGAIAPVFPGFSYFLNMPNVQVAINALASITNVDVVSSPSLMVLDNKKAVLQIGDEVPIATQSAVGIVTPDAPIVNAISFRNTGVILSITPRVSDDNRILLDIEQEVSDVKETTTSTIDSPTIQQRRVRTTVTVPNGESIVLAGMMQDRATRDRGQIPLLGDVPLIGNAFKNKNDTVARTELFIAITPHVVANDEQAAEIAAEFRDRLNFTTRPQRETPPEHGETFDRLVR